MKVKILIGLLFVSTITVSFACSSTNKGESTPEIYPDVKELNRDTKIDESQVLFDINEANDPYFSSQEEIDFWMSDDFWLDHFNTDADLPSTTLPSLGEETTGHDPSGHQWTNWNGIARS